MPGSRGAWRAHTARPQQPGAFLTGGAPGGGPGAKVVLDEETERFIVARREELELLDQEFKLIFTLCDVGNEKWVDSSRLRRKLRTFDLATDKEALENFIHQLIMRTATKQVRPAPSAAAGRASVLLLLLLLLLPAAVLVSACVRRPHLVVRAARRTHRVPQHAAGRRRRSSRAFCHGCAG